MEQDKTSTRRHLAAKTRQYQAHSITWQELIDELYKATAQDKQDDLISELFDLIEHEPKRGGFLGMKEKQWQTYQTRISNVLQKLEQDGGERNYKQI